ncbi:hypothetical protein CONPUDRAFT_144343 [Coniophora puteana RWD-64-598 SS2]|uniref:Nucleotidyl transferase AbiEii/AbiGii toxin family protein n=1 Tax=Coniophora puteana (strain RWD-64-598) TaxID=741705 RepID=A0A5M3MM90_CONPW|nr:uncharacterized protein CONPUDRAFT_144343 [Coniophora puteana RWD-64-598 SS2]EIW80147.1 hypothetical protein CONPUDRAFT_144343 [Coniophora puteana RWD-64-598 SS2]
MAVPQSALVPFFRAMRTALGAQAATTRVSVPGGLFMQNLGLRNTNDIDVVLKGEVTIDRKRLRNDIVALDRSFTPNFEKVCGVTYRDPVTKVIIPIDIIDEGVTGFMPLGVLLGEFKDTDVPWPEVNEVIKMKILSAPEREDGNKGMRDLDDVKALLSKGGVSTRYRNDAEKATIKAALEKALPMYLEKETEWSEEDWKTKLSLV